MILLPHLDSFTSADTFNSRQVFVAVCLTVGGWWYLIFGSGTKLSVTDEQVVKPVVSVYPAASRAHLEGNSSLLCVASAMFPPLVQFSWKRQKKNGGEAEELPPAEGEQLELRESGHSASILLIHQQDTNTYKYSCWVKHEGGHSGGPNTTSVLPVSVQGEAALPAVHSADSEESGVLLWTLSADDPHKQGSVHQLHTC
ncbi:uncharacterized protein LOC120434237 isoform X3 [Oreochromis aureus]|uniref:uncharacterized protein LOC120434237 isoform X3 n=1 Tax=Oreochromis aureus TaxID=47969 RepID=UPI0019542FE7|nr:uncharacterized protein LOC120434237 isoform X3 [Oreochromis aureus]